VDLVLATPRLRVLVIEAEDKVFCAGADLESMRRQGSADFDGNLRAAERLGSLFDRIAQLPLPVLARVQGPAIGGGVGLVAACDVAVASEDSTFSLAEVRLGSRARGDQPSRAPQSGSEPRARADLDRTAILRRRRPPHWPRPSRSPRAGARRRGRQRYRGAHRGPGPRRSRGPRSSSTPSSVWRPPRRRR
jgi:hypothetical protein